MTEDGPSAMKNKGSKESKSRVKTPSKKRKLNFDDDAVEETVSFHPKGDDFPNEDSLQNTNASASPVHKQGASDNYVAEVEGPSVNDESDEGAVTSSEDESDISEAELDDSKINIKQKEGAAVQETDESQQSDEDCETFFRQNRAALEKALQYQQHEPDQREKI